VKVPQVTLGPPASGRCVGPLFPLSSPLLEPGAPASGRRVFPLPSCRFPYCFTQMIYRQCHQPSSHRCSWFREERRERRVERRARLADFPARPAVPPRGSWPPTRPWDRRTRCLSARTAAQLGILPATVLLCKDDLRAASPAVGQPLLLVARGERREARRERRRRAAGGPRAGSVGGPLAGRACRDGLRPPSVRGSTVAGKMPNSGAVLTQRPRLRRSQPGV